VSTKAADEISIDKANKKRIRWRSMKPAALNVRAITSRSAGGNFDFFVHLGAQVVVFVSGVLIPVFGRLVAVRSCKQIAQVPIWLRRLHRRNGGVESALGRWSLVRAASFMHLGRTFRIGRSGTCCLSKIPISSTEQMPIPQGLRSAPFTALVSVEHPAVSSRVKRCESWSCFYPEAVPPRSDPQ
jgi:hypothetical protein